ncbi:uncharacterized protein LOC126318611 [Schistocerca gregaria]|uniref:uncharacterized protein LOC126318611 n=1 Tax=Schistocerca gregaria TaxID=7010 RepID=UPI00211ED909|nr:uncharacterized protein LOC126318611 [Schistocerca gregaria]
MGNHFSHSNNKRRYKIETEIDLDEDNPCTIEDLKKNGKTSGEFLSWGNGERGALGFGNLKDSFYPRVVKGITIKRVKYIHAAKYHSVFTTFDGRVFSHGWNNYGQCGIGKSGMIVSTPTEIVALKGKGVIYVASGVFHSHFYTVNHVLYSSGNNAFGQIGNNTLKICYRTPKKTILPFSTKVERIKLLECGYFHSILVTTNQNVYAWGRNSHSQLGLAKKDYVYAPRLVKELSQLNIVQLACGSDHTVFLNSLGEVYQIGSNVERQFGSFCSNNYSKVPIQIRIQNQMIVRIVSSNNYTCALSQQGRLWYWGTPYLSSGGTSYDNNELPESPKIIWKSNYEENNHEEVRMIKCGAYHMHLLTRNGKLYTLEFYKQGAPNPYNLNASLFESIPHNTTRGQIDQTEKKSTWFSINVGKMVQAITAGSFHSHILLYCIEFHINFAKLYFNPEDYYADYYIETDSKIRYPVHRFFFKVRCPSLLSEDKQNIIRNANPRLISILFMNIYGGDYILDDCSSEELKEFQNLLSSISLSNSEFQISLAIQKNLRKNDIMYTTIDKNMLDYYYNQFSAQLKQMYEEKYETDFYLVSQDGVRLPVHRAIMAARCPFYDSLFKSGMIESITGEHHIDASGLVVDHFAKFCYYEFLDFTPESAKWLLENHEMMFVDSHQKKLHNQCLQVLENSNKQNRSVFRDCIRNADIGVEDLQTQQSNIRQQLIIS